MSQINEANREAFLRGIRDCDEFYLLSGDWEADERVRRGELVYPENPYPEKDEHENGDFAAWHLGWNSCYPERWKQHTTQISG